MHNKVSALCLPFPLHFPVSIHQFRIFLNLKQFPPNFILKLGLTFFNAGTVREASASHAEGEYSWYRENSKSPVGQSSTKNQRQ